MQSHAIPSGEEPHEISLERECEFAVEDLLPESLLVLPEEVHWLSKIVDELLVNP